MTFLVLFAVVSSADMAFAAPDEVALGRPDGYPVCPPALYPDTRCVVGLVSRFDEVFPARKVFRCVDARPLKRAP